MNVEQINTSELIPYARNAKLHSDSQVAAIAGSIKEFGFNNPVLIDKDNGIIAGHGRVLAAQKLKLETVPCIRLSHLTDIQKRAYILADNRLSEIGGGWNEELLQLELQSIDWKTIDGFSVEDMELEEKLLQEIEEKQEKNIFEQSIQLDPAKDFLVVLLDKDQKEEAKTMLDLKTVRRGGYKSGSAFDSTGLELCIEWERVKNAICNTK